MNGHRSALLLAGLFSPTKPKPSGDWQNFNKERVSVAGSEILFMVYKVCPEMEEVSIT